jgi:hypothetical protein
MNAPSFPSITAARALACELNTERARMATAMRRIYDTVGSFDAVMACTNSCLQSLAAQVAEEGGDTGGWVG